MIKSLKELNVSHKRVFLRADLNVPLDQECFISNDFKLRALQPTLDYLLSNNAKIILATHLGRPHAHDRTNFFDPKLSTQVIASWLEKKGYNVDFERDLHRAEKKSCGNNQSILLLENLRFFNGEQGTLQEKTDLAQLLAALADVYVNDAFALLHRTDTSVTLLPEQFNANNRGAGLLIEKELTKLKKLKENPSQPLVIMLGGCKLATKIPLLENLLNTPESRRVKTILIGGAIAQAFLKAQGFDLPTINADDNTIHKAHDILDKAQEKNVKIVLPEDFIIQGSQDARPINEISPQEKIIDIGPETIKFFIQEIMHAQSIFTNGTPGIFEHVESEHGTKEIFQALTQTKAYTVIGGGDSTAAAFQFDVANKIDFISTGGGATLAFLAAHNPEKELPGLKIISNLT